MQRRTAAYGTAAAAECREEEREERAKAKHTLTGGGGAREKGREGRERSWRRSLVAAAAAKVHSPSLPNNRVHFLLSWH